MRHGCGRSLVGRVGSHVLQCQGRNQVSRGEFCNKSSFFSRTLLTTLIHVQFVEKLCVCYQRLRWFTKKLSNEMVLVCFQERRKEANEHLLKMEEEMSRAQQQIRIRKEEHEKSLLQSASRR